MNRHLSFIIIMIVLAAGFAAGYHSAKPDYIVAPTDNHGITVKLEVYKNGKLVYVDNDDPSLKNFLGLLETLMDNDLDNDNQVIARDGLTDDLENWGIYLRDMGRAFVEISDGVATFSRTMYDLPGNIAQAWASATIQNDNELIITGSITVPNNMSITWVGLGIRHTGGEDTATLNTPNGELLLFADQLSTPISANAGDVVTVVYKIVLP